MKVLSSVIGLCVVLVGCSALGDLLRPPPRQQHHPVDFGEAHVQALHAAAAYDTPQQIRERFADRSIIVNDLPLSDVRFYVLQEPGQQTVAIRGTEASSLQNWTFNAVIDVEHDSSLGITTHEGWGVAALELHAAVQPLLTPGMPVNVTGHSMGGALAVLLALHLQRDGYSVKVVTFGQPKVTNLESALRLERLDVTRYVTREDPVVGFPPPHSDDVNRLYSHFGAEVLLMADGRYKFAEPHQVLATSSLDIFLRDANAYTIDDHSMTTYLVLLERLHQDAQEIPN